MFTARYELKFIYKKVKQSHTGRGRPRGFQEVEAPRFEDIRHMKVVRLSALRTAPRKYSWYSFLLEVESTLGPIVRPEGLCQ